MERLAKKFADWMVNNGSSKDNHEIFAYAIECLLNTLLTFAIIIVIGFLVNRLLITVIWILFFLPTRHLSGGLHASNHIACLIFSVSFGTACMLIAPLIANIQWLIFAGIIFSIVTIFAYAPIIHTNHPLSDNKINKMKKGARILILIESILILTIYFYGTAGLSYAALLGMLAATSSTLIGHFHNQ